METRPVLTTDFRLTPEADGPQDIVTLRSTAAGGRFESTAVRTWVTDLAGSGLEADITDPVLILAEREAGNLAAFHRRAIDELASRRSVDYEVADLFVAGPEA
ncbi:hypothetical protein GCM10023063_15870 [Arthrobacter methylotrophus]|uniref:Uncharacterized protein n=1 Tax=Arthrobacter methylotrophus TaxID=121291 RepID=A0ABV5UNC1_9MICC